MRRLLYLPLVLAAAAVAAPTAAHADTLPLGANVLFTGGVFGNFNITNTSAPGAEIAQVKINLVNKSPSAPGQLFFDPTFAAPGALLPLPFAPLFGAGATGFATVSGDTDGSTTLTLTFTDFDPGEVFNFELDVDHTLPAGAGFLGANIANRSLVDGSEFAGSTVEILFKGPQIYDTTVTGTFVNQGPIFALAQVRGEAEIIPEPSSLLLLGSALGGLTLWRRRRMASRA